MIPLGDRHLEPGRVRVFKSRATNIWFAEKATLIQSDEKWAMSTHTTEVKFNHRDALDTAFSWLPKKEVAP